MLRFATIAVAAGMLAGCVTLGSTSITRLDKTSYFGKSTIAYATKDGLFNTEVIGTPFAGVSAEDVASTLRMPGGYSPARFTTEVPADRKMNSHRAVIAFNTTSGVLGNALCSAPEKIQTGSGHTPMKAQIALCAGDEAFAEGQIVAQDVTGFDDPAFGKAINSLLLAVLKQRDDTMLDREKPEFVPAS